MDELKIRLKKLRRANIHHRMFVPELSLHNVMTKDVIFDALKDAQIGAHRLDQIATKIHQSGRKIFAILILIEQAVDIEKFIEADELEDVKLPFSYEFLYKEIGMADTNEFIAKQWELTAPTLQRGTLNRRLKEEAILPFTMQKVMGRDAFGKMYMVELDKDHQELDTAFPKKFAQKELQNTDDHRIELENLSILNRIKHPYIVELLASYTYQDMHYLLFPLADGGTLEALLQTERQRTVFQSDQTFLIALVGLSSAIEHVHDFVDPKLDFSRIGIHHDLRPQNILVSKATLILAGFGLSTFKEPSQDSATPFQGGIDDYLAPECEDYENNFHDLGIRRSSDIWSFGCIITEIATYMAHGENAVKEFKNKREFKVRGFKLHVFHHGPHKESSIVADWLAKLEQSPIQSSKMLVALARTMLVMEESDRPKASEITSRLQLIALSQVAAEIDKLFCYAETKTNTLDAVIERNRFAAWRYAIGFSDFETSTDSRAKLNDGKLLTFDPLLECLREILEHLEWMLSLEDSMKISFGQLCYLNDCLVETLDFRQQERSRSFFRISMSDDERMVTEVENDNRGLSHDKEIRMRVNMKHMTTLAMNHINIDTEGRQLVSRMVDEYKAHSAKLEYMVASKKYWSQIGVQYDVNYKTLSHSIQGQLLNGTPLGSGRFGSVDRVLCSGVPIARKSIRALSDDVLIAIRQEVDTIRSLAGNHHIIQLVGTYLSTEHGRNMFHMLTFPVADCDMDWFLRNYELSLGSSCKDTIKTQLSAAAGIQASASRYAPLSARLSAFLRGTLGCITSALKFVHMAKISHDDIKPANILLLSGKIYITDFGISRDRRLATQNSTEFFPGMTHGWSAPEKGDKHNPFQADIYSLGCIFMHTISLISGKKTMRDSSEILQSPAAYREGFIGEHFTDLERAGFGDAKTQKSWRKLSVLTIEMIKNDRQLRPIIKAVNDRLLAMGGEQKIFHGACCCEP